MSDMSDAASVTFQVDPETPARLDALAAYCGMGRSQLLRTACALIDATMTLSEVARLRSEGQADEETEEVERAASADIVRIGHALRPKGLPLSMN